MDSLRQISLSDILVRVIICVQIRCRCTAVTASPKEFPNPSTNLAILLWHRRLVLGCTIDSHANETVSVSVTVLAWNKAPRHFESLEFLLHRWNPIEWVLVVHSHSVFELDAAALVWFELGHVICAS